MGYDARYIGMAILGTTDRCIVVKIQMNWHEWGRESKKVLECGIGLEEFLRDFTSLREILQVQSQVYFE